jgi:hypothetical protein
MTEEGPVNLTTEDEVRWWRQRGERELCQILFWRWDPIGVQEDLPYSAGEYDNYALQVWSALRKGASIRDVASLLERIEANEIGTSSGSSRSAAALIVRWYESSRRYWQEFDARA